MTCTEAVFLIHLHRPGERSEKEEQALASHLHTCSVCRKEVLRLSRTSAGFDLLTHTAPPEINVARETRQILQKVYRQETPDRDLSGTLLRLASMPAVRIAYGLMSLLLLTLMTIQLRYPDDTDPVQTPMPGPYIAYTVDTTPLSKLTDLPVPEPIKAAVRGHRTLEVRKTEIERSARLLSQIMLRSLTLTEQQRRYAETIIDGLQRSSELTIRIGRIGG